MAHVDRALKTTLDRIATELNYDQRSIKIIPVPDAALNYTSKIFHATITGKNKPNLNLFAKVAVIGEKIREQGLKTIFKTEQYVYTHLKNIYRELEEKHNVPEEHRLEIVKCYGFNAIEYEETIVFDDLSVVGYTVQDRLESMNWEFAAAVVTELAKLHSLSFAYANERPKEFETTHNHLQAAMSNDNNMSDAWDLMATKAIEVTAKANQEWMKRFLAVSNMHMFPEYCRPLRRPVLIHSDLRNSNIMRKTDINGRLKVQMVDYQTIKGGSPVIDLIYFIFTSSDGAFRAQYYKQLINYYYEQLSLCITRLHLNPNEVYSRDDFNYEFQKKLPFGLSVAVFCLPAVTVDIENAPKVDENMDISSFSVDNTSELFSERLNGIVNDFIRWGVM